MPVVAGGTLATPQSVPWHESDHGGDQRLRGRQGVDLAPALPSTRVIGPHSGKGHVSGGTRYGRTLPTRTKLDRHACSSSGRIAEDIPTNHNPRFAPVIHPTLETGIEAMTTAALDALVS